MSASGPARFWIGPSGWQYDDWNGVFYPADPPRGFQPLAYLARYFDAVEINSSFYRMPTPRAAEGWVRRVRPDFRFAIKLTQHFTHQRLTFPPARDVDAFKEALRPLREAARLGPILIQFPWSFRYGPQSAEWLARLADAFADYARAIEVRHASWAAPEAQAVLAAAGGVCSIDQPRLHGCLPPSAHVTGGRAYVRLHGRNARTWFAEGLPPFERYNYLYNEAELKEWVQRLRVMAGEAEEVYVFANNHYKGQGPVNALELKAMLGGERVSVPPELLAAYPRLRSIARPEAPRSLFDAD